MEMVSGSYDIWDSGYRISGSTDPDGSEQSRISTRHVLAASIRIMITFVWEIDALKDLYDWLRLPDAFEAASVRIMLNFSEEISKMPKRFPDWLWR